MLMSYSELIIYINEFGKNEREFRKELARLQIAYIMQASGNYKKIPSLDKIIKLEAEMELKKTIDTTTLQKEMKEYYNSLIVE